MNPEARLSEIVTALEGVGLLCLVMGGHAVRYYGLQRNTSDFDLHLAPEPWDNLPQLLGRTALLAGPLFVEGPSWRPHAFRRFQIGRLADGREEWLEFWRTNHLLPPFTELYARREEGGYGERLLPFLALPDLIRSKETERNTDWQDIAVLEEILDGRLLAQVESGRIDGAMVLTSLRSRRGFERLLQKGRFADVEMVRQALRQTRLSITQAFLLPFLPDTTDLPNPTVAIEPIILNRLRTVTPGSTLHLTLVEAVRRHYKIVMQDADRADKAAVRKVEVNRPPSASS